ncbi:MAG: RNA pseudouridine synthase [Flavobacteriia bacterium]|nr:RNA pseudouridine synthase [Flavobacteriia bacterium]
MLERNSNTNFFRKFESDISSISQPKKFTFPFYYSPNDLSTQAAKELQTYLSEQNEWNKEFWSENGGKMFGVLVVENDQKEIGYLSAFSGRLFGKNFISFFVPPIYDILDENCFYHKGEDELNQLTEQIIELENSEELINLKTFYQNELKRSEQEISNFKIELKASKKRRDELRSSGTFDEEKLIKESQRERYQLKELSNQWKKKLTDLKVQMDKHLEQISQLKNQRKILSAQLQEQLFQEYIILNSKKDSKDLIELFSNKTDGIPPSGAGDCAAPKLLQFAFQNDLKPISMAEFWWGASPKSEVRLHENFYAACKSKCEPILNFMLEGIEMEENPLFNPENEITELEIIHEDDFLLVVNKPANFLSVPGKSNLKSIYDLAKEKYPNAEGPLIVHRLDMATSGLLLIAKSLAIYQDLQAQFINRTIQKRYIALLDGIVEQDEGIIDLPLRADITDRPRQLVCYEHGKAAKTKYKVLDRKDGKTLIYFYPITGRTHQLRIHAAHLLGLNAPIVGDELYGKKSSRLHLHAEMLEFQHSISKIKIGVESNIQF